METKSLKAHLIVIVLLSMTSLTLALTIKVSVTNQAGVKIFLPEHVNDWAGAEVLFCQQPACRRAFLDDHLDDPATCPECGGKLDNMSLAEHQLLPDDTIGLKRQYAGVGKNRVHASLVMSGSERGSIHRPEVCLVGQGRRVVDKSVLAVPLEGREDLQVMVLDLLGDTRRPDGRRGPEMKSYYAYWFVGKDRETPYHWERIFLMGVDRIFRNVSHRWAYIAVGGGRDEGSDAHLDEIRDFVRDFYPQMQFN